MNERTDTGNGSPPPASEPPSGTAGVASGAVSGFAAACGVAALFVSLLLMRDTAHSTGESGHVPFMNRNRRMKHDTGNRTILFPRLHREISRLERAPSPGGRGWLAEQG
jgi:hypothetical protein